MENELVERAVTSACSGDIRLAGGPVIGVVGPTASGKSELAQAIAQSIGGEVVSADAMQVYRGMDIGTGKVPLSERRVPHQGLDLVNPGEAYSAALFQTYARSCFSECDRRGSRTILCGGTGFYVRAAIDDYSFPKGEQVENPVRERWNAYALFNGPQALWDQLNAVDPASAGIIPPNDVKRVVRAFELREDGTSYAVQKAKLASIEQLYPVVLIGLRVTPSVLKERIEKRVDEMFAQGLVDEVTHLLDQGFRSALTAQQAIGYKEVVAALDGECTMDEAATRIKTATRHYAKRQRTWFRKDKRIVWINADDADSARMLAESLPIIARADEAYHAWVGQDDSSVQRSAASFRNDTKGEHD
ncbi:MAG: tRNA (adenosine(37)-N6)-dimethylallyltransferase MiaA [Eggerthellaceae bacterium]|jgi:tRNA dimethylallyltransferase